MTEFSPMFVLLLVPMSLFVLGVGRIALSTVLGYRGEREPFAAPRSVFDYSGTPQLLLTETVTPRGPYALRRLEGGSTYRLPLVGSVRVGRAPTGGGEILVVAADTISGDHADIEVDGAGMRVRNLSRYGSWINDRQLLGDEECPLKPGDALRLGDVLLSCEEYEPGGRPLETGTAQATVSDAEPLHEPTEPGDGEDDDGIKVHWVR